MTEYQTQKISVNYNIPIEDFSKLKFMVPIQHDTHRTDDLYVCADCGGENKEYDHDWSCVSDGHAIRKHEVRRFETRIHGPFRLELSEGINSSNFPRKRKGKIEFQVTLFSEQVGCKPLSDWKYLEAIKRDGYDLADAWQLISYFQTYPEDHILDIIAAGDTPISLCTKHDFSKGSYEPRLEGFYLELAKYSKNSRDLVNLVLGIKK